MKKLFLIFVIIYVLHAITFSQNNEKVEKVIGSEFRVSDDKEHIEYVRYLKVTKKVKFPKLNGYKLRQYHTDSVKTISWNYEKVLARYDFIYSIKPNELWKAGVNEESIQMAFKKDSIEIDNNFRKDKLTIYHPFFWKTENIENHYTLVFDKEKNTFFLKKYSDVELINNWWRVVIVLVLLILTSIRLYTLTKSETIKQDLIPSLRDSFLTYILSIFLNIIIGIIFVILFFPKNHDIYLNMYFENERVLLWFARSVIIFLPSFIFIIINFYKYKKEKKQ